MSTFYNLGKIMASDVCAKPIKWFHTTCGEKQIIKNQTLVVKMMRPCLPCHVQYAVFHLCSLACSYVELHTTNRRVIHTLGSNQ